MHTTFRPATTKDVHALHAIRRAAILGIQSTYFSPTALQEWADKRSLEHFILMLKKQRVFLAENASTPVAWGSYSGDKIKGLYVHPSVGGSGIGRMLMDHLESLIKAEGHAQVRLAAAPNAIGFYRKLGYSERGHSQDGISMPLFKNL